MACCIIAAYLWALAIDRLRRIAIFWGLARPRAGEVVDNAYTLVTARLRNKRMYERTLVEPRSRWGG